VDFGLRIRGRVAPPSACHHCSVYSLNDTIVAVSSPSGGVRSIVRVTGLQTLPICNRIFRPQPSLQIRTPHSALRNRMLLSGSVRVHERLAIDALLYLFFAPHSYTGEPLAEIHVHASQAVVEALVQRLLAMGLRAAGPGEFTARAYLNGKLDLAQAEAVNEIVSSSNRLQLDAAQRLLSGRLTTAAEEIRSALLDVLSLIEAGLDFSGEDIEFISPEQAAERLEAIRGSLEQLLTGSIQYETLMDLPAVGIAGAPNAGKSTLLNTLLGWERSIVSEQARTTRDVLSGLLTTDRFQCVLFDCAGLIPVGRASPLAHEGCARTHDLQMQSRIDELAQYAAVEALQRCHAVLFCVDLTKPDWSEDIAVRALIQPKDVIHVATKSDLLRTDELSAKLRTLAEAFHAEFLPVSAKLSHGLDDLCDSIERSITGEMAGTALPASSHRPAEDTAGSAVLLARHKQAIVEAMENVRQATEEVRRGNDEVAVTMLRAACQAVSQIEQHDIDEQVLDRIFSRFCIGK
jgi:tRNA modification GTPase